MRKGSIRGPIRGQLFEVATFFTEVLTSFHKNAVETVVGLIDACIHSSTMSFCILSAHFRVGNSFYAWSRRLERYANEYKVNMNSLWCKFMMFCLDRHIGTGGPIRLIMDWTEEPPMMTLCVSLDVEGKGLVLWCKTYKKGKSKRGTQKRIEMEALQAIHSTLGSRFDITILGDRGFGCVRVAEAISNYGYQYILRIKGDAIGQYLQYDGAVSSWMIAGNRYDSVIYSKGHEFKTDLIAAKSIETRRNSKPEQWMLMTNVPGNPKDISNMYAHRWGIEAQFKDIKHRLGYKDPRWKHAEAIDRLWFIMACVMELAVSTGATRRNDIPTRPACSWEQNQRCVRERHGRVPYLGVFLNGILILRREGLRPELLHPHPYRRCFLRS